MFKHRSGPTCVVCVCVCVCVCVFKSFVVKKYRLLLNVFK